MLFEWKRISEASAVKDLKEALKMIGMGHLMNLDKGTRSDDT